VLALLLACQAPAPAAPTAAPAAPTAAPAAPTPVPPTPTAAPPSTAATRLETLNAANFAYKGGDVRAAAALYERVINTPPGATEGSNATVINDFAHFRAMLALLTDSREDEARVHLDALQRRDANAP